MQIRKSLKLGFIHQLRHIEDHEATDIRRVEIDRHCQQGGLDRPAEIVFYKIGRLEIDQIDLVVVVAMNKTRARSIETGIEGGAGDALLKGGRIKILDVDTCISKGFDWSWVVE